MQDHSSIASPPSATSTFCFRSVTFEDSTSVCPLVKLYPFELA
uniref:Uncharacterized protein n=1 Tax=Zea mays TaxID=4577 RepID=C0PBE3_MAIZE|nr:unknown [Zea mays]